MRHTLAFLTVLSTALLSSCTDAYYSAMEQVGIHKRDIMVSRVDKARTAQQDAKTQFSSALEHFRTVVQVSEGQLEARYDSLNAEYQASVESAETVRARIQDVKSVAEALFKEWEEELKLYSSPRLKAASSAKLGQTRQEYQLLVQRMERAEQRIDPVLQVLQDQVLYLKHNLNAQALGTLEAEYQTLESNVDLLLADMQQSIDRADTFIRHLQSME